MTRAEPAIPKDTMRSSADPLPLTGDDLWDTWNRGGGTKYPQTLVVDFCLRTYPDRRAGLRALDLGCGSGVHTIFLAAEGFRVMATDKSIVGVENTRRKARDLGLDVTVRAESADMLTCPPRSVDLALCIGVYDSAGPLVASASLARVREALSPGGWGLFIFASDRDHAVRPPNVWRFHGYTRSEVDTLFSSGFDSVHVDRTVTTYHGGAVEQNEWIVTVRRAR